MPEHREGTPTEFRLLESFLWHDLSDNPSAWATWLQHRNIEAPSSPASFETASCLHAALRDMQAANAELRADGEDRAAIERINQLIDALAIRPLVDATGDVRLISPEASHPVGRLLIEALDAMRSGAWVRFKLCREPTCRASFYDASKAARKIWCEMTTCGSQNKMRRYRARR